MLVGLKVFMDAHKPVTLEEGDRYPLGPPNDAVYGSGHPFGLISQESQVRILPPQPVLGYFQQYKNFTGNKAKRILLFLFQSSTAVVQLTVNQLVVGSIPASGAIFKGDVAQW